MHVFSHIFIGVATRWSEAECTPEVFHELFLRLMKIWQVYTGGGREEPVTSGAWCTLCLKKRSHIWSPYILNNSEKNEPILTIFGLQNSAEISHQKSINSLTSPK